MSLRGNGGGSSNSNRGGRRGGSRGFEGRGNYGGQIEGKSTTSMFKPPTNPNPHGPIKILQSRRNEDVEAKPGSATAVIPTILQSSGASTVPRIAVRPKAEPTGDEKQVQHPSTASAVTLPPPMPASIKFFDDNNTSMNKGLLDYLTNLNTSFHVVAIIGAQGSGKSTFASMLSGNQVGDLYGEYIFRPSPREYVEKGASQTTAINVYVTKARTIILDCQAINSGHIFELALRSSRREGIKLSQVSKYYEDETHKLLMLIFEICHTIILGIDWFIDINIIREIMTADLSYRKLKSKAVNASLRNINLVIAQLRSRSSDFQPETVAERSRIIKGIFEGSRFDVCGGLSMKKLGLEMYHHVDPNVNYIVFAEIKPRSKMEMQSTDDNYGLLTIPFYEIIEKFNLQLLSLPRLPFTTSQQNATVAKISEKEWFLNIVQPSWEKLLSSELTSFSRK